MPGSRPDEIERLRRAVENVRMLAATRKGHGGRVKEGDLDHLLRFCAEAGVVGSPVRDDPDRMRWAPIATFTCSGVPRSQGSKKLVRDARTGRTRLIDDSPAALKRWRTAVGWAARAAWRGEVLQGPMAVRIAFRFAPYADGAHDAKPDIDKLLRAILDSLTGICWVDDCQVAEVTMTKRWGRDPGVQVEIWPLPRGRE